LEKIGKELEKIGKELETIEIRKNKRRKNITNDLRKE